MKKKHYSYLLGLCVGMIGLQACSSEDNLAATNAPQPTQETPVYKVNIPATIGDDAETRAVSFGTDGSSMTASFEKTDLIYVCIEEKNEFACDGTTATTLSPTSDGTSTTLTGTLKFPVAPEVGDILTLCYNMNVFDENPASCGFRYIALGPGLPSLADGSAAAASDCDFAKATMKIKAISGNATDGYTLDLCKVDDNNNTTATFEPLQSMFRFRFSFKGKDGNPPATYPTITKLVITSDYTVATFPPSGPFVNIYTPMGGPQNSGSNTRQINSPAIDGNHVFYLPIRFNYESVPATENLTFTATASDGIVYEKVKTSPTGGFKNGKYYYGNVTLAYKTQYVMPTITGSTAESWNYQYDFYDDDFTIEGTSMGYCFTFDKGSVNTVTLKNLTATYDGGQAIMGTSGSGPDYYTLNLVLDGDCTIDNSNFFTAISLGYFEGSSGECLKLSTANGGTYKLSITCQSPYDNGDGDYSYTKGIQCQNYYRDSYTSPTRQVVANLAYTGFTVTLTSETDNHDGTSTYVYTVAPLTP